MCFFENVATCLLKLITLLLIVLDNEILHHVNKDVKDDPTGLENNQTPHCEAKKRSNEGTNLSSWLVADFLKNLNTTQRELNHNVTEIKRE